MKCGACGEPATRQWQRQGTEQETSDYHATRLSGALRVAGHRQARALLAVVQLEEQRQRLAGDPRCTPAVLAAVDAQLARARADREAVNRDTTPVAGSEPVVVAVFACERHAVPEADAARIHNQQCAAGACNCQ